MMTVLTRKWCLSFFMLTTVICLLGTTALAASPSGGPLKPGEFNPDHESVEMFQAIERGQIEVKIIPRDSTECNVLIENKSDRPLNVELPAAFVGVPVLAQFGGGMGGMGGGGGTQAMGGGMGGMGGMGGGGMGGGGMGGGFFNVAPERVGQFKVPTVCLEHGKRDPRPAVPYVIRPIEEFTDRPAVHALCQMLGSGQLNQRAAQFAAWMLQCDMSWQELAAKRLRFANGTSRPYFSPMEIQGGVQLATMAVKQAEQQPERSPGEEQAARAN
jgi:hypothetical protein